MAERSQDIEVTTSELGIRITTTDTIVETYPSVKNAVNSLRLRALWFGTSAVVIGYPSMLGIAHGATDIIVGSMAKPPDYPSIIKGSLLLQTGIMGFIIALPLSLAAGDSVEKVKQIRDLDQVKPDPKV